MDHNTQGRRPHYHRGRRGSDRRGGERRSTQQPPEHSGRPGGDHVDVEQIMRDIRARIAQRHGIELTTPQIQELAARRLEAILDPRTMNPTLTEQLRKAASNPIDVPMPAVESGYEFDESTLFDTHRGVLRVVRRLLNPILKLFFNSTPLVHTLHTQARLNKQAAAREAERERRQTEWNALHYEILNRLVTEVSRTSIEAQTLSGRIESLAARVDFTDRRVRAMESAAPPVRTAHHRGAEAQAGPTVAPVATEPSVATAIPAEAPAAEGAARRKRRRRRGRRSGGGPADLAGASAAMPQAERPMDSSEPFDGEADEEDAREGGEPDVETATGLSAAETSPPPATLESPFAPAETQTSLLPPAADVPAPVEATGGTTVEASPVQPAPPPDEPEPSVPVDQPDPGPPDR